jgi:hypothetical protein
MPEKSNGSIPPESLHFERGPLRCWNCNHRFDHFVVEIIDNLTQLRCDDVLIANIRMACLRCGRAFTWDVSTKNFETMAVKYGQLMVKISGYNPE